MRPWADFLTSLSRGLLLAGRVTSSTCKYLEHEMGEVLSRRKEVVLGAVHQVTGRRALAKAPRLPAAVERDSGQPTA